MSVDITEREEIKHVDVSKGKTSVASIQSANRTLEVGKTLLYPAINHCFDSRPNVNHPLVHESMPQGESYFQNYLIGELFPRDDQWRSPRSIEIEPVSEETMKAIKAFYDLNKAEQLNEILDIYKDRIEEFKEIRFSTILYVFSDAELDGTKLTSEDKPKKERKPGPDSFSTKLIKELILITHERCEEFTKNINKDLEDDKPITLCQSALKKYKEYWENYFLSSVEISAHLNSLNEVVNEATEKLLPGISKKIPKFSVWRLLVGSFKSFVYMPLRKNMKESLMRLIKSMSYHRVECQMPDAKSDLFETTAEEFNTCQDTFQAMMDMGINEVNVHYMKSRFLQSKVCSDILGPLEKTVVEICEELEKKCEKGEKTIKTLQEELALLKNIFIPCIWDKIETSIIRVIVRNIKSQFIALATQYLMMTKEERAEKAGKYQKHTGDNYLTTAIEPLKGQDGKALFKKDDILPFIEYLRKNHTALLKKYVDLKDAEKKINNKEKRVTDMEIEIKNESLGILMEPNTNDKYMINGIHPKSLSILA